MKAWVRLAGANSMAIRSDNVWGATDVYRVVRYHKTNWYGMETTAWKVERLFRRNNNFHSWEDWLEIGCFNDEDEAILFCTGEKERVAAKKLEKERRQIIETIEVSQRWRDFEEALASLDESKKRERRVERRTP